MTSKVICLKHYSQIVFLGDVNLLSNDVLLSLKDKLKERLEHLRSWSVLSESLSDEDSIDEIESELSQQESGEVMLALKLTVDTLMNPKDLIHSIEDSLSRHLNEDRASGNIGECLPDGLGLQLFIPKFTSELGCEEEVLCKACGGLFIVSDSGVSNHVDCDMNIDHEVDADHVAY